MIGLNATHNPELKSWVTSANQPGCDFPIQNLPFGVFRRAGSTEAFRGGVAIGDQILDLSAAHALGAFSGDASDAAHACSAPTLNAFMALGPKALKAFTVGALQAWAASLASPLTAPTACAALRSKIWSPMAPPPRKASVLPARRTQTHGRF